MHGSVSLLLYVMMFVFLIKMMMMMMEVMMPCLCNGSRADVVTVTPWLAPVVWEGTFNPFLLDSIYKRKNITIAATVFAVGK